MALAMSMGMTSQLPFRPTHGMRLVDNVTGTTYVVNVRFRLHGTAYVTLSPGALTVEALPWSMVRDARMYTGQPTYTLKGAE